jgi:hypothetical protein
MKAVKITLGIIAIVLVAIQFLPNKLPANIDIGKGDIVNAGLLPEDVALILKTSCYDCHSNQTNFPWYSKIAPTSWLLSRDINQGRSQLNFSEWNNYSKRHMIGKLEAIKEEVISGEMPLPTYVLIHKKAKLTPEKVSHLTNWADDTANRILGHGI